MNIVELPKATLSKNELVLRSIADEIESGAYGKIKAGFIVLENDDGELFTFGSGAADYIYAFSLLVKAQLKHSGVID